jgi:hypothetical protein
MRTPREKYVLSKFRVKIKSLAEEAKIIRAEERRHPGGSWIRGSLRDHRTRVVRNEQRATLIAYAFVRRMPLGEVERHSRRPVDVGSVARIVASLAGTAKEMAMEGLKAWMVAV